MIMSRLEAGGPEDMSATEWRAPSKDHERAWRPAVQ
jgi:hypothetical protein